MAVCNYLERNEIFYGQVMPRPLSTYFSKHFILKHPILLHPFLLYLFSMKTKEQKLHTSCMSKLGLSALEKDDNITPNLMVQCCEQLLRDAHLFGSNLRDLRLRISHYYSVLQDGEMCIPWDWKTSNR